MGCTNPIESKYSQGLCNACFRQKVRGQRQNVRQSFDANEWPTDYFRGQSTQNGVFQNGMNPTNGRSRRLTTALSSPAPCSLGPAPTVGLFTAVLLLGGFLLVKCRRALKARRECLEMDEKEHS